MTIRKAVKNDANAIIAMINELAEYERLASEVKIDEGVFISHIFEKEFANALVAVSDEGEMAGYAIFFHSFSTFLGKAGIYLEDLYVKKEFRGRGIGMKFIKTLAEICQKEGFGRLEWECLDWNEPSIEFYENLGAKRQKGWLKFRLNQDEISSLVSRRE